MVTLTLARCFLSLFSSLHTYTYTYTYSYYYCPLYFLVLTKPAPAWLLVRASFLSFFVGFHRPNLITGLKDRSFTLSLCLSELRLINLFFILFLEQPWLSKRRSAAQSFGNPQLLSKQSQDFEVRGQTRILWWVVVEGGRERVQDSRSVNEAKI